MIDRKQKSSENSKPATRIYPKAKSSGSELSTQQKLNLSYQTNLIRKRRHIRHAKTLTTLGVTNDNRDQKTVPNLNTLALKEPSTSSGRGIVLPIRISSLKTLYSSCIVLLALQNLLSNPQHGVDPLDELLLIWFIIQLCLVLHQRTHITDNQIQQILYGIYTKKQRSIIGDPINQFMRRLLNQSKECK